MSDDDPALHMFGVKPERLRELTILGDPNFDVTVHHQEGCPYLISTEYLISPTACTCELVNVTVRPAA